MMNENKKEQGNKKWLPWLLILVGALVMEVGLCNVSAWKSLFYKDRVVFENAGIEGASETGDVKGEYVVEGGTFTVHIPEVNREVHNLFFSLDCSEITPMPYVVSLTDEGNAYSYALPEQMLVPGVERSRYTNIYPAGKVTDITVQFTVPAGSVVWMNGIAVNARIPFAFHMERFLVILGVLVLFYCAGNRCVVSKMCTGSGRQHAVTAVVILLLMGMAWKMAHVNPICITSPWPHHKQYQELAEAMAKGQLHLDIEPSEGLLNAPNPYDTIYLQANGIDYRADYAYHEGTYYVYFGIVPELLLYLPCYLLTGHQLPNYMAVYIFFCGFILAVFALLWEVIKRWFPKTPYFVYLLTAAMTVCGSSYLFVIARPDMYDTPIMAANMFTVAGLMLWIKGKYAESVKNRSLLYGLGSLCMALVAGCRPQMLLFSFLAVPLFWEEVIRKRELFSKRGLRETVFICLPYVLTAAGIMYYNGARFGSPFDFGATYSLTSNDMTKRSFNLHQMMLGLWHYLFRPPVVTSDFPFLQGVQVASGTYMGKFNAEYTYGGMLAGNAFLWILLAMGKGRELLKKKNLYSFVLVSMAVSVVLSVVDATGAGILQRYMVDMIWGLWLAAVLLLLALIEGASDEKGRKRLLLCLTVLCLLQTAYGMGIVFGNGDLSVNVRTSNPWLYYEVKSMFMF